MTLLLAMLAAIAAQPMPDAVVIERLLAGDESTFRQLVAAHHAALVRVAQYYVIAAVAEEVVQDTWLALLTGLEGFEQRSSLKTWLFRVLVNRAKTRGVRDQRMIPLSIVGEEQPAVDPTRFLPNGHWRQLPTSLDAQTPETLLENAELRVALDAAIDALPPSQRAVITLRDVQGLQSDEVCQLLQLSEANQRVLLHRGRAKLRTILEDYLQDSDRPAEAVAC